MVISHIAMYTDDLEGTKRFFQQYFGASAGALYHNRKTGFQSYFLTFGDGTRLECMHKAGILPRDRSAESMGYIHIAFSVGSAEAVDELTLRLREDGYETVSGSRTTGDGYYESCIRGPEGNLIEITI